MGIYIIYSIMALVMCFLNIVSIAYSELNVLDPTLHIKTTS